MSIIEELTEHLNACKHPRAIYNALMVLASSIEVQSDENPRAAVCQYLTKREVLRQEVKGA